MSLGIDISYYDPILVWKEYTWDFAFIKASEGTYPDADFAQQWKAARGWIPRAAYHFFRPNVNITNAVDSFLQLLKGDIGELPPILDLEAADGRSDTAIQALRWLDLCEQRCGQQPIVYTSPGFANLIHLESYPEFKEYKLWQATYPYDEITSTWTEAQRNQRILEILQGEFTLPTIGVPRPWLERTFLQWTAKCPRVFVPGYYGAKLVVDINSYTGTREQLYTEFNIHLPPKEGDDMNGTITLLADLIAASNFRNAPGIYGTTVYETLQPPLTVHCIGQRVFKDNYYWMEVVAITYPPDKGGTIEKHGWIALTTSYTNLRWNPDQTESKKIVKSTILFDDGTTLELFPK